MWKVTAVPMNKTTCFYKSPNPHETQNKFWFYNPFPPETGRSICLKVASWNLLISVCDSWHVVWPAWITAPEFTTVQGAGILCSALYLFKTVKIERPHFSTFSLGPNCSPKYHSNIYSGYCYILAQSQPYQPTEYQNTELSSTDGRPDKMSLHLLPIIECQILFCLTFFFKDYL